MTQPTSDDIEKMIDAAARGSMEKRAKVIEDAELREQIDKAIKNGLSQLKNADGHGIMRMDTAALLIAEDIAQLIKSRDASIRIDELELLKLEYHNNIVSDDRMDMEIDERLAVLRRESDQAKEGK